jgi:uncharacterized membrane protein
MFEVAYSYKIYFCNGLYPVRSFPRTVLFVLLICSMRLMEGRCGLLLVNAANGTLLVRVIIVFAHIIRMCKHDVDCGI